MLPVNTFLPFLFMAAWSVYIYTELWISLDRSIFVCDYSASFPVTMDVVISIKWRSSYRNVARLFETLESKIDCSIVDTWLRNVSNVRMQLILTGMQMYWCMYDKKVICSIVSALMVLTTHGVVFFPVFNQDSHSGCSRLVCGLCWNVWFNYNVDQGSSGD